MLSGFARITKSTLRRTIQNTNKNDINTVLSMNKRLLSQCVCGYIACLPPEYCVAMKDGAWINDDDDGQARACLAPYQGSTWDTIDLMLDLAKFDETKSVMDIGSGDGRILIRALQRNARKVIGWELRKSIYDIGAAHLTAALPAELRSRAELHCGDFTASGNMRDVDVVTMFLLPSGLAAVQSVLINRLYDDHGEAASSTEIYHRFNIKPPAIVTAGWPIPNWQIESMATTTGGTSVYLMKMPSSGRE